jgi:SpoVK/Ycf46/Vps4 family AAA+-type ATPase
VLFRDDESVAIAVLPADAPESRFEIDVARLEASLEDLVGMDSVIEPLIEDVLMCVVHPEIRRQFDLRPLRGLLLYSYKPGMGKTALMRALAVWLKDLGERLDFDVVLYSVKPNELKSIWHGGDAKLVREELCGAIAARQALPRTRPLFQIVVLDEIDALGKRAGGDDRSFVGSSAHNDAVQALLVEMDGLVAQLPAPDQAPAHVLWVGLTNRPDLLDDALKRPGRFGDLVLEVPAIQKEGAAGILEVYARGRGLPWWVDGEVTTELDEREIRERFLQPAVDHVFEAVVLRYHTDARRGIAVSAGEILSGVHYKEAMNLAKKRAAKRRLLEDGPPAIGVDDVTDSLLDQALAAARQMDADRQMLQRQLRLRVPVSGVELTARGELADHVYVLPAAAPAGAGSAGR